MTTSQQADGDGVLARHREQAREGRRGGEGVEEDLVHRWRSPAAAPYLWAHFLMGSGRTPPSA